MSQVKIVGIVLVRNEDLFVSQAVRNIASFCDALILCDHGSTDGTAEILDNLARSLPHASVHRLGHPSESHNLLKAFAGTRTWVFGVDGDELYDPRRLQDFRARLLAGEFDRIWRMKGNVLHCTSLCPDHSTATGHPAPPSRSITKLY
ncbi:MAG: glycosyltransferase family A protein, partial [Verrucomicrobiota bacterium]